jgi:hypothetical protein
MALAMVKGDGGPRKRLQAIEAQPEDGEPESLAGRLAAARAAVTSPRRRVAGLEAELAAAVEKADYDAAAEIQKRLPAAREELALAEVDLRVLTEAQVALDAAADAERRSLAEAQQRDAARRRLAEMQRLEAETLAELDAKIENFWAALRAAKAVLAEAKSLQWQVGQARAEGHLARVQLGEVEPGRGPDAPNKASVLVEYHAVARAVDSWAP